MSKHYEVTVAFSRLRAAILSFSCYADFLQAAGPGSDDKYRQKLFDYLWHDFDHTERKMACYKSCREDYTKWK